MASSAITPIPPCSDSNRRGGHGFTTSRTRNTRNPTNAPRPVTGSHDSVISIPTTSSMTTGPGSVRCQCRSATPLAHTPAAKMTTIAAASATVPPNARSA